METKILQFALTSLYDSQKKVIIKGNRKILI